MVVNSNLTSQLVEALEGVLGNLPRQLHEPSFTGNEWKYLKDCLDSNSVSSIGSYVDQFENNIAELTGANYAVAVVNGTAALHISLKLAGVMQNDEVIIPALTFVATANAVTYCGAQPHFVDIEEKNLGIDTNKLHNYLLATTVQKFGQCVNKSSGRVIRAIVPMHTFGHPSNIDGLLDICKKFNLFLIEDAAEALGSYYKGKHVGTFGLFGTLSFNGNKTITTGGGGVILTNNSELAKQAKHLTTTAKIPHKWKYQHDQIGFNYRMPNINAAIGCAQLEQLESKLQSKRLLFKLYKSAFDHIPGIKLFKEPESCKSNYWLQTIILDENQMSALEEILEVTNNLQIKTRPVWDILSDLNPFKNYPKMDLENARSLSRRIINIPSSPNIINS